MFTGSRKYAFQALATQARGRGGGRGRAGGAGGGQGGGRGRIPLPFFENQKSALILQKRP